ncbi:uncharacterized protein LOC142975989 [Anticarsia gemmatalis]|uniref:uncharacterized protein LOC142975989 n=1 Tax=Anticarsia gemmatalis TaxID=129554 RepID=UPI003F76B9D7
MSLTKLLKVPLKIFKKEVVTFVIIRRYDLGVLEDRLRYISVKPSASISVLRQKLWHLLDLPDFAEEVIVIKSGTDVLPLTCLRKGNEPQHPFILEVWLPGYRYPSATTVNKMLTIGNGEERSKHHVQTVTDTIYEAKQHECGNKCTCNCSQTTISTETIAVNKLRYREDKLNNFLTDFKRSELSCRISTSSLFRINGKKSRENFTNVLLKIQSDLSNLTNKLTVLENRITS